MAGVTGETLAHGPTRTNTDLHGRGNTRFFGIFESAKHVLFGSPVDDENELDQKPRDRPVSLLRRSLGTVPVFGIFGAASSSIGSRLRRGGRLVSRHCAPAVCATIDPGGAVSTGIGPAEVLSIYPAMGGACRSLKASGKPRYNACNPKTPRLQGANAWRNYHATIAGPAGSV